MLKSLGSAVLLSIIIGPAPVWMFSAWEARIGAGWTDFLVWTTVESLSFSILIWFVYDSRPRRVKCINCGQDQPVE